MKSIVSVIFFVAGFVVSCILILLDLIRKTDIDNANEISFLLSISFLLFLIFKALSKQDGGSLGKIKEFNQKQFVELLNFAIMFQFIGLLVFLIYSNNLIISTLVIVYFFIIYFKSMKRINSLHLKVERRE